MDFQKNCKWFLRKPSQGFMQFWIWLFLYLGVKKQIEKFLNLNIQKDTAIPNPNFKPVMVEQNLHGPHFWNKI